MWLYLSWQESIAVSNSACLVGARQIHYKTKLLLQSQCQCHASSLWLNLHPFVSCTLNTSCMVDALHWQHAPCCGSTSCSCMCSMLCSLGRSTTLPVYLHLPVAMLLLAILDFSWHAKVYRTGQVPALCCRVFAAVCCCRYLNHTGLMWENAPDFGALLVFAEHRWGSINSSSSSKRRCSSSSRHRIRSSSSRS